MGARTVSSDEEDVEEREDDMEDNEAGADNDENDEDDEEEDIQDEYEKDDFIVDDVEEEEEEQEQASSDEEARAKKKKRKKRDAEENYELDEDDYELLQEANVTGFHRPKSQSSKTKFKRLKKAGKVASEGGREGQAGFSDDELEEGNRHGRTAEEKIGRTLFGDDEGGPPDDLGEEEEPEEEEEDIGEEDDMADFIVDEDEVDENGQPVRRGKTRKRAPRQAVGISSMALQEAQEIFGDVTELLDRRKFGLNADRDEDDGVDEGRGGSRMGRSSKNKLEEEFEPSVLEERYMTERDNHIRETDVPERLQLLEELIGTIPLKEPKVEEAEWIYDQGFGYPLKKLPKEFESITRPAKNQTPADVKAELVKQIAFVLTMLHDSKLEIPFTGMYRKEDCAKLVGAPLPAKESKKKEEASNLRDFKLLWQIFYMDKKWWLLQRKKEVLADAYEKRARIEEQKNPENLENLDMIKKLLTALQEARSQVAVDDVDAKYTLYFPSDDLENDQSQFKRPKKRSLYSTFRKAGLGVLARQFGLTPEQFGENLQAMYKRHEVEDSSSTPEDLAAEYSEGEITDPQSVLRGARHMAAVEISIEPVVRDYCRNMFSEKAVVSTKPTKGGNTVIDSYHDYALVKWISGKPLSAFKNGQWLTIQKAEEEKLIEVSVGLPKDVVNNVLMQEFETMYLSDGVSRTAQLWNEQRRQISKDAVTSMLLPLLEKEARMLLTVRAKQWVGQECGATLWTKVSTAPWKEVNEEGGEDDELPRVLACSYGDTTGTPTTFVMLDSAGEIVNTLHTPHIFSHENDKRKQNDMERLQTFMLDYQPQIAVVGAGGGSKSVHARKAILQAGIKLIEMYPKEVKELENMHTDIVDESLARIYEASSISKEQLPGQPGIVRRAVYLGRYLQSPLAAIAALCGPNRELLSFTFHELQNFLTDDERYSVLEQVMVTITNQVGIDVNMAVVHDWLFAPLQFVCGLGARKASVIQRSIQGAGRISNRKELLTQLRLVKKLVFINACAFLRISNNGQTTSGNQIIEPLDDTRVHPESYDLARGMAEIVYRESQKQEEEEVEDEIADVALEYAKRNPRMILTLDVEEYSKMVDEREGIKKPETLKDIQKELVQGFKEWRYPYTHPTDDEVFTLLTGENDQTLGVGRLVTVKVIGVIERGIRCELGHGLYGMIQKDDFSDESTVDYQQVPVGSMITCRVKNINKRINDDNPKVRYYSVDLTCKSSAMRVDDWEKVWCNESYFARDALKSHNEQEKATKAKDDEKRKSFKPRMIVHPQFQNISMTDAIEGLVEKDVGEIIIRPSSKGPTHLSITLKFYDGVYTHIDILEGGKDSKDFTSFLSLGKSLKIGEDVFEDLDEVIARYVDPLVSNLKEMLRYRKFRRGRKEEVDSLLKQEKLLNQSRIAYAFSVSHEHPGAFLLSYLRSSNIHHEYISLYPKGYRFRKRMFEKIDKLVKFFQEHVNDPVLEPNRSLAAMVPMKGPAPAPPAAGSTWGGADRRSPASWDNNGWNAGKGTGQTNWERLSAPSAIAGPGTNWSARGGLVDGWGQGAGDAGGDGWEKGSRLNNNSGRSGRADSMAGGGRFGGGFRGGRSGRGDGFNGSFGGGRSGRGRGGRWEAREGQTTRGAWGQGQERGGWGHSQTATVGRAIGATEDDGWAKGVDTDVRANDAGGWGQQEKTKDQKDNGGGWEEQVPTKELKDGWGQQNDEGGWGQQTETKAQDGWGDVGGGWG